MIFHVRCVPSAFFTSRRLLVASRYPLGAPFFSPKAFRDLPFAASAGAKWLKTNKKQRIFNIFRCPLFDVFGRSRRPKRISGSPLGRDREMYRAPWVPPGGPSGFRHLPQEGPKTPQGANLTSQSTPGASLSAPQGSQDTPRAPKSNSGTQNDLKVAQGPKHHVFGTSIFTLIDVTRKKNGCAPKIPYRARMSPTLLSAVTIQRSWTSSKKEIAGV